MVATVFSLSIFSIGASAQTPSSSALEQRVQRREARINEKLTAAQQTRLKARCKAAQIKITAAHKVALRHYENQDKKVEAILTKLNDFSKKQKDQGADTAVLQSVLTALLQRNQDIKVAYENYISALGDAADIDCQADPSGFKASLLDAREQFQALKTARQELRKTLKDTLLPALKELRSKKGDS